MVLLYPEFTVQRPPGLASEITDANWWLWCRLQELEPTSQLGGIYARKPGFHNRGDAVKATDYSIRDWPNRLGPWWKTKASALDWTFPEAHSKDYRRIAKYMQRLLSSARDPSDPRLDLCLYEFFGQADNDTHVEGWNEYRDVDATSDISHWFHIHFSELRMACGDFWAMWALLTVLMGLSVAQWRDTLPNGGKDMAGFSDDPHAMVMAWRMDALAYGSETIRGGPQKGETMWAVKKLNDNSRMLGEIKDALAGMREGTV